MKKGFTLIEMLIAIVVIGMIIGILIGLMGNPLKEATIGRTAAKIGDDLRALGDAADHYYMNNVASTVAITTDFVGADGALKTFPAAPTSAGEEASYAYLASTITSVWGGAAVDTVAYLPKVSDDVCQKVNELYAGMAKGAAIPTALDADLDIQCVEFATVPQDGAAAPADIAGIAANDNVIVKVLFVD